MPKPVTNVLPAQPAGPKPVWRDLFQEPTYRDGQTFTNDDQPTPGDDENCLT